MASRFGKFARLVKLEHTIFALPFAYAGAFLAARGLPELRVLLWITLAMVGARNAAMGLNRVIDREIDRLNPRTAARELPRGVVGVAETWIFSILSLGLLAISAWELNPLALELLPLAVVILVVYPYAKRFTRFCHYYLAGAEFFAPFGGWIAVTGRLSWSAVLLGLGVGLWVGGFDILYAFLDLDFDRSHGIHSLPADLGIRPALWIARITHVIAFAAILSLFFIEHLGIFYLLGTALTGVLLVYEHILAKPGDNAKINAAFFNINGLISMSFFLFILLQETWPHG